ncbi:LON peptidase substrate-binding domain-containing protein [Pedobacter sp. SD-b]|uniref:LON peptidase substrate-binding domain-containing protein n=2 Tax=Pedobacter segetis TaxID=2793069 RepID=A0ABS1BKQ9_9SPHI|nr:LON peptidase substrate-binding domain-containing protein [Pedobacter segetis]
MDIAIFPLQLIAFPGERLNLHVFEQRYRDLFNDLKADRTMTFGIPPVVKNEIHLMGTQLKLVEIVKQYETGEMDVITEGIGAFAINKIFNPYGDKAYAGANVEILLDDDHYDLAKFEELQNLYEEFQAMLTQRKEILDKDPKKFSFQIAHYAGLNEEQKLALLATPSEEERQEIMIDHFKFIMPSMRSIQETQSRIIANGHFKNLQSFKFNPGK